MPARHGYLEQAVVEASASAINLSHTASSPPHPAVVVEAVETVTAVHLQRSAGRGMSWEMGWPFALGVDGGRTRGGEIKQGGGSRDGRTWCEKRDGMSWYGG